MFARIIQAFCIFQTWKSAARVTSVLEIRTCSGKIVSSGQSGRIRLVRNIQGMALSSAYLQLSDANQVHEKGEPFEMTFTTQWPGGYGNMTTVTFPQRSSE